MLLLERKQEQQHEINKIAIGVPGGALAADEYDTTYKVYCGSCKSHELA